MKLSSSCQDEIKKQRPPVPCPPSYCLELAPEYGQYCHKLGLPPNTPVLLFDPDLNGPGKGGYCYCCCDGCGYDMPIEVAPGQFVLAHDVRVSDHVMAAKLDPATGALTWRVRPVGFVTDPWPGPGPMPDLCLVAYAHPGSTPGTGDDSGALIVAADHLFLMDDAKLKPAKLLAPGDRLRRAAGGTSEVAFVVAGSSTLGVRGVQLAGDFDGVHLDGHLLNANGVVCADYAVQVHYASNQLSAELLHAPKANAPRAGTPEHTAGTATWPAGFIPANK